MTAGYRAAPLATPGMGLAPMTHGVGLDRSFYSLDAQAGRPVAFLLLGRLTPAEAGEALTNLRVRAQDFCALDADLVALVEMETPQASAHAAADSPGVRLVVSAPQVFEAWGFRNIAPALVALDAGGRILAGPLDGSQASVAILLAAIATLPRETPFDDERPAPVLAIPRVLDAGLCRELIAHFEASRPGFGGMAARDAAGQAMHKIDAAKKHRYDLVLQPPLANRVLAGVAARCLPEISRAFQVDIAHTDRLLLARYDAPHGYFRRHRDNSAPEVAFRQFALTINLNDDYDGGHLLFPECNDRRYRPRAGAGVVFSCSLLHEATPILAGRRYCALTFLHDAAAQARRITGT